MKRMCLTFAVGVAIATLTGCATSSSVPPVDVVLPAAYKNVIQQPVQVQKDRQWWRALGDEKLNSLISQALTNNVDVKVASAQILAAQAVLKGSNASFFPAFDLAVDGDKGRLADDAGSGSAPVSSSHTGQVSASYQMDLWGRLADISASNDLALKASEFDKQAIELTVISGVTKGYLTIQQLDAMIDRYQSIRDNADQSLSYVNDSYSRGLVSSIEVENAKSAVRSANTNLRSELANRDLSENALALLVGDPMLKIGHHPLEMDSVLPVAAPGIPSQLLLSRPDIMEAEATLRASDINIDIAKKAFFPQITLTSSIGKQSTAFSSLLGGGSRIWSLGYGLDLPLFDGGLRVATLWQNRAEQQANVAKYKNTVQTAFKNVDDSIVTLNAQKEILHDSLSMTDSSLNVFNMMTGQYNGGLISYNALLGYKTEYRNAQIDLIERRYEYLTSWVNFNNSLGM